MTTSSQPTSKAAVSRSNFLHTAAILSSAFLSMGLAGPVLADAPSSGAGALSMISSAASSEHILLAQATSEKTSSEKTSSENTMARCQQLFGLWSRHNTDGYAKPLDARMGLEQCQKGDLTAGIATLKRALERAQITVPPADSGVAQSPTTPLRPRGEKRHSSP